MKIAIKILREIVSFFGIIMMSIFLLPLLCFPADNPEKNKS